MSYRHDVFISYKRETNWTPWTRDHFKALMQSYLQSDLGHSPDIFVDQRIETQFGHDWIVELAEHLAASKVVVALFSRDYFSSDWCVHELDLIVGRMMQIKQSINSECRLIVPVVGHDGDLIPEPIAHYTSADIRPYRIACMHPNTSDYHEFSKVMREISPAIAEAVRQAPAFDAGWVTTCVSRFKAIYQAQGRGVRLLPTHLTLKPLPTPAVAPRLIF